MPTMVLIRDSARRWIIREGRAGAARAPHDPIGLHRTVPGFPDWVAFSAANRFPLRRKTL